MEEYRRKFVYQDQTVAESYMKRRFSSAKGRTENELTRAALSRALNEIGGARVVLDLPCGTGRFTQFFLERGYRYVGADVSMEMIRVLRMGQNNEAPAPSVVRCDAEHLPFKDNAFDYVASVRFLNHLPRAVREKTLGEMRRVSRQWLIVESRILKFFGPFVRLKIFVRRWFQRDVAKYELHRAIITAGWKEKARVPIGYKRRYIGIYQKSMK